MGDANGRGLEQGYPAGGEVTFRMGMDLADTATDVIIDTGGTTPKGSEVQYFLV